MWTFHVSPRFCVTCYGFLIYVSMWVWLITDSELPVSVNVSVFGCFIIYVSPAMKWYLNQSVSHSPPNVSWDKCSSTLQPFKQYLVMDN